MPNFKPRNSVQNRLNIQQINTPKDQVNNSVQLMQNRVYGKSGMSSSPQNTMMDTMQDSSVFNVPNGFNSSNKNNMQIMAINNKPEAANEQFVKTCLEMIPTIANKLLDTISKGAAPVALPVPEKKYDMKLQKEISELQGKQLLYKCPGASVISFDGPGIDCFTSNDKTSISLNQRFA